MLAAGCGSLAVHFSSSFFTAIAQLDLDDALTPAGTTYGQSVYSSLSLNIKHWPFISCQHCK